MGVFMLMRTRGVVGPLLKSSSSSNRVATRSSPVRVKSVGGYIIYKVLNP